MMNVLMMIFFKNIHFNVLNQIAQTYTRSMRSWSESPLRQALELSGKRINEEIEQLLNKFWNMCQQEIKQRSHEYIVDADQTFVLLKKV